MGTVDQFEFDRFLKVLVARGIIDNDDKAFINGLITHDEWKNIPYDNKEGDPE